MRTATWQPRPGGHQQLWVDAVGLERRGQEEMAWPPGSPRGSRELAWVTALLWGHTWVLWGLGSSREATASEQESPEGADPTRVIRGRNWVGSGTRLDGAGGGSERWTSPGSSQKRGCHSSRHSWTSMP